jgi:ABC-type polysaccharide/polyol phosphate transport system ATPase subunit
MARIELDDVSLTFRVRQHRRRTLKEFLLKQMFRRSASNSLIEVRALQNVTLHIQEGDRVGIIGHNGAGKSTLLKLLAGIYPPSAGRLRVDGRVSSLFELAMGFEWDGTGWENISYRCYLQGETRATVRAKQQAIAEFSELGEFLNMPLRYYSAGMMVRLAFSIATAIEPEILLLDEVLGAGDLSFQQKARQRLLDMMSRARLILLVSHDLKALPQMCERTIWMDHGQVRQVGPTAEVVDAYRVHVRSAQAKAA